MTRNVEDASADWVCQRVTALDLTSVQQALLRYERDTEHLEQQLPVSQVRCGCCAFHGAHMRQRELLRGLAPCSGQR